MQITRNSLETNTGPSDWFTGTVFIDPVATASEPSRLTASSVHFTPGARNRVAHPPLWPDHLRHRGHRALPAPRRPDRGHPPR
jgi:hypothetical protein